MDELESILNRLHTKEDLNPESSIIDYAATLQELQNHLCQKKLDGYKLTKVNDKFVFVKHGDNSSK